MANDRMQNNSNDQQDPDLMRDMDDKQLEDMERTVSDSDKPSDYDESMD